MSFTPTLVCFLNYNNNNNNISMVWLHETIWVRPSLASHTLRMREEGSGHAATIELSPQEKLDVTNHSS